VDTGALAVRCSRCQHENGAAAKFCEVCGTALAGSCPRCGHAVGAAARFCAACGHALGSAIADEFRCDPRAYTPPHLAEKILGARSALQGERKQVTVLFADVKGSMELAEQLDPEVYHLVMERFAQLLAAGVHRFEGTVNQYTGDGIMALFGAPIAHEDHAQRACYAALHLREELSHYAEELKRTQGLGFAVRMGINSGEVVVGTIGGSSPPPRKARGTISSGLPSVS
jgi:class 3 adenylate cyclase